VLPNEPALQMVPKLQDPAPPVAPDQSPGAQRVHEVAAALTAPSGPDEPGAHAVPLQTDEPVEELYCPLEHCWHRACARNVAPGVPHVPAGHCVPKHDSAPFCIEKRPAGHSVHVACAQFVLPRGPKEPLTHPRTVPTTGCVVVKLDEQAPTPKTVDHVPLGHRAHVAAPAVVAPSQPYEPDAQGALVTGLGRHSSMPVSLANVPLIQASQPGPAVPSGHEDPEQAVFPYPGAVVPFGHLAQVVGEV
jgi:hypothetical protein